MLGAIIKKSVDIANGLTDRLIALLLTPVYVGRCPNTISGRALILMPVWPNRLLCGLAGLIAFKNGGTSSESADMEPLRRMAETVAKNGYMACKDSPQCTQEKYLGGDASISGFLTAVRVLKCQMPFVILFQKVELQEELAAMGSHLQDIVKAESAVLTENMGHLPAETVETMSRRIDAVKDIAWCLKVEISENIRRVAELMGDAAMDATAEAIGIYKNINIVLNAMDRLEVRGRDSAGISVMFTLDGDAYGKLRKGIEEKELSESFQERLAQTTLVNKSLRVRETPEGQGEAPAAVLTLTYKVAAEIGSLGDNIRFLRQEIRDDAFLSLIAGIPGHFHTITAHTRWASVGAITVPNCHPVDNVTANGGVSTTTGTMHVSLNGDIDNYLNLKAEYERDGNAIQEEVTTDTKIIPIQIQKYIQAGHAVEEAFRMAVNDFEGSHAISMHTDLDPGKLFLAQRGSGQAVFVGISPDHFMPTSEVYGFVESTDRFIKMDGEKIVQGTRGQTQGQIYILDRDSQGHLDRLKAFYYDGTPIQMGEADIKHTEITSRDIDRQQFPHYFLKEISESPVSVEKTLQNRWKIKDGAADQYTISLDERVVPQSLRAAFTENRIRRIFFVGQGTAGVAALACANILQHYLDDPSLYISALKASELSGFQLKEQDSPDAMADTLLVAISQSGTTTDTNRTVDMVRQRGAHTLAIVNRRDSDITFKVDGVIYTSSGRDIEMSVASTKAFYSQIIAGAVLGLFLASLKGRRDSAFMTKEIKQLLQVPEYMRQVLSLKEKIEASAKRLAVSRTYWAAVGSGPNKASADEIRIKLSELCYKTISTDYVEDKKHIDLSSEPLILICAAGTRGTVIGDIIKDTAIFQAHKALPVVIADAGEHRFAPYAADVFHVPSVGEHLAPILNTLVGHIWGYYAALAINDGSRFLHHMREDIQQSVDAYLSNGMDIYEITLEKSFRERIVQFYQEFRKKKAAKQFPGILGIEAASDLTLLLKYLTGRLPVSDFELDFGIKGTAMNMLTTLFRCLGEAINAMARPVDAIKHQAKTVTVGTSRISEKVEGILFEALENYGLSPSQLTTSNVLVLRNLQKIVAEIRGAILYRIDDLNLLGEPTDDTTIHILKKDGILAPIPSRVETDTRLKGTKRIIVRQGNVYIGKGRKDNRSIIVIPAISGSGVIDTLLLVNIGFKPDVPLESKIKALGGKYEHIKNIVQENSLPWQDTFLEVVPIDDLFGKSAEKVGEFIISRKKA